MKRFHGFERSGAVQWYQVRVRFVVVLHAEVGLVDKFDKRFDIDRCRILDVLEQHSQVVGARVDQARQAKPALAMLLDGLSGVEAEAEIGVNAQGRSGTFRTACRSAAVMRSSVRACLSIFIDREPFAEAPSNHVVR